MGTTAKGYPYPEDTDLQSQGAQAIKALANAIDTNLGRAATGTASLALPTANVGNSVAVTFPVGRFTAAPAGFVNRSTTIGSVGILYQCQGMTTSGMTIVGLSTSTGGTATLQWLAVQAP